MEKVCKIVSADQGNIILFWRSLAEGSFMWMWLVWGGGGVAINMQILGLHSTLMSRSNFWQEKYGCNPLPCFDPLLFPLVTEKHIRAMKA
jgi:hypothetical protein